MKSRVITSILVGLLVTNLYCTSVQASEFKSVDASEQVNVMGSSKTTTAIKRKIMDSFMKNEDKKNYKKDEVLVKVKTDIKIEQWLKQNYSVKVKRSLSNGVVVLTFDSNKFSVEDMLKMLNNDSNVEYAEPNYSTKIKGVPSNEPLYKELWGLKNYNYSGMDTNVELAWSLQKNNSNTVIGVIDTGIDYNHKDLDENIWINQGEVPGNGIDDDNNEYIDDYIGWNFAYGNNDPYDDNEHGTHVSGIIAALNNGIGTVGVSPNTKIMPLKVGDAEGNLYSDDIVAAISYGLKKGVKVFNCSFSGGVFSQVEYDAMKNANALFIVAAGNEGNNNDVLSNYPGNYELPNIISVGSIDENGGLSGFSNYGVKSVDIAAPGGSILSTIPNGGYEYFQGTSMAAPHVSGVVALMLSEKSDLTPVQIREYILKNNRPVSNLSTSIATGGIVDAGKLIGLLNNTNQGSENGWISKDGKWYFYKNGQPLLQWQYIDGHWYYFNAEGIKQTGWIELNGYKYYLQEDGVMATGWKLIANKWYFLANGGPMVKGWLELNGYKYYLQEDGVMATGWKLIDNKWYFLANGGPMIKGWLELNGYKYYLQEDGVMATGWKLISNKWYFLADGGPMIKGWLELNGYKYYLQEDGTMATGWKLVNGKWYFLADGGPMIRGWLVRNGYKYYLQQDGIMTTGWKLIDGKWYYFYQGGNMAVNTYIDGYKLGPTGIRIA